MKDTIVLYPSPERSHVVSMVELAKLILTHYPSFTITVIIAEPPFQAGSTSKYVESVSTTVPSIIFHRLPTISATTTTVPAGNILTQSFELARRNNPNFHQALLSLSKSSNIKALILDFFCNASFETSTSLQIPTYYYITGNLSGLTVFLYLPTLHKKSSKEVGNELIDVPGWQVPIPAKDMPSPMRDPTKQVYKYFLDTAIQMPKSSGIIVNAVDSLEKRALKAIMDGLCTPGEPAPSIYCLGPLLVSGDGKSSGEDNHECMNWLDSQPKSSVLFLNFGGHGKLSAKQLREMAIGLETSGVSFLWVVRPPEDIANDASRESFFPDGFLERTKNRGYVVESWVPQVAVLSHESVGGFVTHCGWNSVVEAVRVGVPMLARPLFGDQGLNKVVLVEEWKAALPLVPADEDGVVTAAELEKRIRELMYSEKRETMKERIMALREVILTAYKEDGPSRIALDNFVGSIQRQSVVNLSS